MIWKFKCGCGLAGEVHCPPVENYLGAVLLEIVRAHGVPPHWDWLNSLKINRTSLSTRAGKTKISGKYTYLVDK